MSADSDFHSKSPMRVEQLLHHQLSETIIGAAMKVLNILKPGLDEKAYENAMVVELTNRGCRVQQQMRFDVRYEGVLVYTLVPDLIVNETVIGGPEGVRNLHANPHGSNDRLSRNNGPSARPIIKLQIFRPALATRRSRNVCHQQLVICLSIDSHPRHSAKSAVSSSDRCYHAMTI